MFKRFQMQRAKVCHYQPELCCPYFIFSIILPAHCISYYMLRKLDELVSNWTTSKNLFFVSSKSSLVCMSVVPFSEMCWWAYLYHWTQCTIKWLHPHFPFFCRISFWYRRWGQSSSRFSWFYKWNSTRGNKVLSTHIPWILETRTSSWCSSSIYCEFLPIL